jgi:hypothetical protein
MYIHICIHLGDVLRHLLACMVHDASSEDLKTKAKRALKAILAKCTHLAALQVIIIHHSQFSCFYSALLSLIYHSCFIIIDILLCLRFFTGLYGCIWKIDEYL